MANTPVKKQDSDVVAQDANVIDMSMFATDAGIGNKEVDQDSLSIPFLKTNLTKQIRALHKGSSEGDVINTVTNSIYNGEEVLKLYLVHTRDVLFNGLHKAMIIPLRLLSMLARKIVQQQNDPRKIIKNILQMVLVNI